jgi:glycosyltransferase involved in cell wall biosynthesis
MRSSGVAAAVRILVVSPFCPHAGATHGGGVYAHALLAALARRAEIALVAACTRAEAESATAPPAGLCESHLVVHRPLAERGGVARLSQRLGLLWQWGVRGLPLSAAKARSRPLRQVLRRAVAGFRPAVCLLEHTFSAQYLPDCAPVPTVLTDYESGDPIPAEIGPFQLGRDRDRRLWTRYTRRFYRRATLVQTVNQADAERLAGAIDRPVEVRPTAVLMPAQPVRPERAPPRLLFLGNYTHHPNPESARFLASEVLPRVRARCPHVELWLAGTDPSHRIAHLAAVEGVRVVGFVAELPELLGSARCLIAPVFSGRGNRIKVQTALAHGLPVVANALGLLGIAAPPAAALGGETADELAAAALAFLENPAAAAAAGAAARAWAEATLGPDAVAEQQLARLASLTRA